MNVGRALLKAAAACVVLLGCTSDVRVGSERRVQPLEAGAGGAGGGSGGTVAGCEQVLCLDKLYACGNCFDDDGDGLVDMDDPDCLGPCHNAEDTFYGSIPGQNHAPCIQDCYFDHDTGSGNDDCVWSHACDMRLPEGDRCPYDPTVLLSQESCGQLEVSQPQQCKDVCGPLVPNGCDCFGCCEIPGAPTPVWLGSVDEFFNGTCNLETVGNPALCKPCTLVDGCFNPCDSCELCVGKRDLPPGCPAHVDGSACTPPVCPNGEQACGVDCLEPCPSGQSCITGCCVLAPR